MADKYISEFPTHTPAGTDYLAVEDNSETGKATINNIVEAAAVILTTLRRQGLVPTGTDINTVYDPGVYALSASNTYTNQPTGVTNGMLLVLKPQPTTNYYVTQFIVSGGGNAYIRIYTQSWSAWKTL